MGFSLSFPKPPGDGLLATRHLGTWECSNQTGLGVFQATPYLPLVIRVQVVRFSLHER